MPECKIPRLRTHIPRSIPPIPYPWHPLLGAEHAGLAVGDDSLPAPSFRTQALG